mmetsp:Transcript_54628/g.125822  ORF Transcript_54628/g.125822 Transcript_54628/m.125822 type:complete len:95 (-) Transcript_54628:163-447(-)
MSTGIRMCDSYAGLLLTVDVPIKQFILHLDEQQQRSSGSEDSFVVQDLDETTLLVKEESLKLIRAKLDEMQNSNAFVRTEPSIGAASKKGDKKT